MEIFSIKHGILADLSGDIFTSNLYGHTDGESNLGDRSTHSFGIVLSGSVDVKTEQGDCFSLSNEMYFSLAGAIEVRGKGNCLVAQKIGYRGLNSWGGPLEKMGRLCYIDNCMTTLLVSPARFGDPCLNLLTFPGKTTQTLHIHPSLRFGVVVSGSGSSVLGDGSKHKLEPGSAFYIPRGVPHCFHSSAEGLRILAYHPDSDFGPTDKSNPMLNRTYVHY